MAPVNATPIDAYIQMKKAFGQNLGKGSKLKGKCFLLICHHYHHSNHHHDNSDDDDVDHHHHHHNDDDDGNHHDTATATIRSSNSNIITYFAPGLVVKLLDQPVLKLFVLHHSPCLVNF